MNTKGFSNEQKAALLDLLILGMYQDGHLAAAEDERVQLLVNSFDLETDYAKQQFVDASFGRVARAERTQEATQSDILRYGAEFKSEEHRRRALDALAELLASDSKVTNEEHHFLVMVEEALNLKRKS